MTNRNKLSVRMTWRAVDANLPPRNKNKKLIGTRELN